MNPSRKHLKLEYNKYISETIRNHGITLDKKMSRRLNCKDKKHVKQILNTLYGYGIVIYPF